MTDYIQKIRSKLGHDSFIHPAARIVIENEKQEILVVEKRRNGKIYLPAGAFEENESIEECIKREVWEESGLELLDVEVIGISTKPENEVVTYPNGDVIQYFTVEFYSNSYRGELKQVDRKD